MTELKIVEEFLGCLRKGDGEGARRLLEGSPGLASVRDPAGVSALMLALYYRLPELARTIGESRKMDVWEAAASGSAVRLHELLGELPARAGETSPDGFSPLGLAAFFGHEECTRILVENGADINARAKNPACVAPLHSAVAGGHHGVVRYLLERGALVNLPQQHGFTPLHGAAATGNEEMLLLLLTAGADPALKSDEGKTPLDIAIDRGHSRLAAILGEDTGAKP